jgi:dipeptidyl aminopeptidase/acylaminoacyl peptidase
VIALHNKHAGSTFAAATLLLVSLLASVPGRTAPVETYGRLPSLERVAISPDGSRLAVVQTAANKRVLLALSLADHKVTGKLDFGDIKIRGINWADEDHLVVTTSVTTLPLFLEGKNSEWYVLQVWDIAKGKLSNYPNTNSMNTLTAPVTMNVISGPVMVRRVKGHTMLFIHGVYLADYTLPALFRVDLDAGSQFLMRQGTLETIDWLVDEEGEIVAEEDYNQKDQRWRMLEGHDGHLREIASGHEPIDVPELLGFGPTPNTLLVETREDGDPVWRLLSMQDGSFGAAMTERDSLEAPIEDRLTHRMIGGAHLGDTTEYVFFDKDWQGRWQSIKEGFSGEQVELVSASSDFKKVVVQVNGPIHGFSYMLMDMTTRRAELLGEVYKGLGQPLEVKRITYEAADGLKIPAYLTLPSGRPAQKLPLIVFPHGGPAARDSAEFDWWAQAMASQGYLVLQPNYRGSTVTSAHMSAGFGQFGRKMQTDLSDGISYLVKEGMVDPARVCIVGASYGGYAALAGITLQQGIYRCAVSVAGISDLKHMLKDVNWAADHDRRFWNRFMGVSGPSDPLLQQISPIKHVDAITVPVLLIHGKDDTVVTFDQSSDMFDAMKHAKKDVEMVTLKGEDHHLSRSETRLQMLQATIAFLRAHNPPD